MNNTFPSMLIQNALQRPDKHAIREKEFGIWQTWSWQMVLRDTKYIALGLHALGFQSGENLVVIGNNRPYLYFTFIAVQSLGGIPIPMYQTAIADEIQYVFEDASARFAFAEDQEQVDKLLEIYQSGQNQSIKLDYIFYDDQKGMRNYDIPGLMSVQDLMVLGHEKAQQLPDFFNQQVQQLKSDDVAIILYTSGTTGRPKGVCQTHDAFIASAKGNIQTDSLTSKEEMLSYLPPAWAGDYMFSVSQWLVAGYTINCPESASTVALDLKEIGPTYYFAPPPIFESMLTNVYIRMEDAAKLKQWLFNKFMNLAQRVGTKILDKRPVSVKDRFLYMLGEFFIYGPLKNTLGLSRVSVAYTAGAAIGPDLFMFYRSLGVNLKQLYGQTETCGYVCIQRDGEVDSSTVGPAAPGMEIKLSKDKEVLVKGVSLFSSYYKLQEATKEAFDENGYFKTGDAGIIYENGDLRIIDRAKDVGRLNDGTIFAPNYLENKLKFFPQIKEAVCFGHEFDYVCAFINIELEAVGNWAERKNIPYAGYVDLAGKPEVLDLIRECVEKTNRDLSLEPEMSAAQIKRFVVLHKELDADDGELTRTSKVRRKFVSEKYKPLVDALYGNKQEQFIETAVKFEDGRSSVVSATLKIIDVQPINQTEVVA